MITGAGPSYRIMHSIIWLGPDQLEASPELFRIALNKVDNNAMAQEWARGLQTDKHFTPSQIRVKVNRVRQSGSRTPKIVSATKKVSGKKITRNPKVLQAPARRQTSPNPQKHRIRYMDKKELRTLICSLAPSTRVHITFTGSKAHLTTDYTVCKIRTGKGRGGSKIIDLVDAFKNTVSTGTKDNESILNITVAGTMHGHASEAEAPSSYVKDRGVGEALRPQFNSMLDAEGDYTVRIESPMPDLQGTWVVNKASKVQGRVGQTKLMLENVSDGRKTEVWSYRHSGAISKFEILGEDGMSLPAEPEASQEELPGQFADNPDEDNDIS